MSDGVLTVAWCVAFVCLLGLIVPFGILAHVAWALFLIGWNVA